MSSSPFFRYARAVRALSSAASAAPVRPARRVRRSHATIDSSPQCHHTRPHALLASVDFRSEPPSTFSPSFRAPESEPEHRTMGAEPESPPIIGPERKPVAFALLAHRLLRTPLWRAPMSRYRNVRPSVRTRARTRAACSDHAAPAPPLVLASWGACAAQLVPSRCVIFPSVLRRAPPGLRAAPKADISPSLCTGIYRAPGEPPWRGAARHDSRAVAAVSPLGV
ncbi:hypothetical protein C8Q77DRAFT_225541 [Trametes polyzona]|nr:hypothetical protein C8Q77DRAFT_225541 [Trametes polyzona]